MPKDAEKKKSKTKTTEIKFEKRFPKEFWEIKEDENDIVIVPKNPRIFKEAQKLLVKTELPKGVYLPVPFNPFDYTGDFWQWVMRYW